MYFVIFIASCLLSGVASEVCYGKYGCYNNKKPFNRPVLLPLSPSIIAPKFRLYTRSNMEQVIDDNDVSKLEQSYFNGTRRTVFIIHGYIEFRPGWAERMKDGLLKKGDFNVIKVDWLKGALPPYLQAAGNTRVMGAMVAELIKFLMAQTRNSGDLYHIVGFSLGSHIAGYAGTVLRRADIQLGRITGLDPAGPLFADELPEVRLDPTDAQFVDAIHTDSDRWGLHQVAGHIDFYPNGGADQIGCQDIEAGPISLLTCDHFRATDYFIDSLISPCAMEAIQCNSADDFDRGYCLAYGGERSVMGFAAEESKGRTAGRYYLYTREESPFCVRYYTMITFETRSGLWAGITARVVVKLFGTEGTSEDIELRRRFIKGGSTETLLVPTVRSLGSLNKIEVRHKGIPLIQRWKLGRVLVKPGWDNQLYTACFNASLGSTGATRNLQEGNTTC